MSGELRAFLAFGGAALLALVTVPAARHVALRTGFLDTPRDYKKHASATPYLGGAGVLAAFVSAAVLIGEALSVEPIPLLIGLALLLSALGSIDDRRPLGPGLRFSFQVAAAVMLWMEGVRWDPFDLEVANLLVSVVWIVGLTNAFNLLDNMDGACATTAAVSGAGIGVIALGREAPAELAATAFALSGACAAFLLFNFSTTRKIFLGDGGSMPIGFLVASLSMLLPAADRELAVLAAVPLVAAAIFDTTLVVVSRRRRGVGVLTGGRDHSTHRLLARLGTPQRVCGVLAAGMVCFTALSFVMFETTDTLWLLLATGTYIAAGLVLLVVFEGFESAPAFEPSS